MHLSHAANFSIKNESKRFVPNWSSHETLFALLLTAVSASAHAAPKTVATFNCGLNGASTVKVQQDGAAYTIAINYTTVDDKTKKKHAVNITSQPTTLDAATTTFSTEEMQSVTGDAIPVLTHLPSDSVAFAGFHYPNGQMYVVAENDSNEEGYIFAASKALIDDEAKADVADLFWSEFHPTEVSTYGCERAQ